MIMEKKIFAYKINYFIVSLILAAFLAGFADAKPVVKITVSEVNWGVARTADIKKVLESAALEITRNIAAVNQLSILVEPSKDGSPRTLYRRGVNGEFIVWLTARDRYWAQYAYQFSHEMTHVLTMNRATFQTQNQWFEETLGEICSRFAIRAMAKTWRVSPPYPNWKSYSTSLDTYAEDLIKNPADIPGNTTFVSWFRINFRSLQPNPYLRDKNAVIARRLQPLFEGYSESWDAVAYLNQTKPPTDQNFHEYLSSWYRAAPRRHQRFIAKIGNEFGLVIG